MNNKKVSLLPKAPRVDFSRRTLTSQVHHTLKEWLADGELLPGQRLTGRALSEQLGVSQTPVREAMMQLVAEQSLDLNPNRSVTVPLLSKEKFIDLRDIRVALESLAVRCAIEKSHETPIEPDVIRQISNLHEQMMVAKRDGDFRTTLRLNRSIHFLVYRLSKRDELVTMIQSLWTRTGPYLNFLYKNIDKQSLEQPHPHLKLIEALQKQDSKLAEEAIQCDILVGGKAILYSLETSKK